jgi:hypothetical protein
MEIIIAVVVFGAIAYLAYNAFIKEKSDGSHALDVLSKPVEKAPEPVVATPVAAVVSEAVVETPAPVVEATPAKKAPAKKAPAKKAPAKPKSA